jgi:protein-L-isoaspartate(D-aspartate) O-methyltransferase
MTPGERMAAELAERGIHDERVLAAMATVPRDAFVPERLRSVAYDDTSLAIGCEQTISQPMVVAATLEAVAPRAEDRALEVGAGSGYVVALLARLCREVVGIERVAELAAVAGERLARLGVGNATVVHADGAADIPGDELFQVIVVSAAADRVPPALINRLDEGGRLAIPLAAGDGHEDLTVFTRRGDGLTGRVLFPVRFVPLLPGSEAGG